MERETSGPVVVGWMDSDHTGAVSHSPFVRGMEGLMPIFRCSRCGVIENTACSNYWCQVHGYGGEKQDPLCSECDPEIGKWHGSFPKDSADGMVIANDGFLYSPDEVESDSFKFRMKHQELKVVGKVSG